MTSAMTGTAASAAIGTATGELRVPVVRADASRLAELAQRSEMRYLAFLAEVLSAEVDERSEWRRGHRVSEAKFPRVKRLSDFDLAAAPTVNPVTIATLAAPATWMPAGEIYVANVEEADLGGRPWTKSHGQGGCGACSGRPCKQPDVPWMCHGVAGGRVQEARPDLGRKTSQNLLDRCHRVTEWIYSNEPNGPDRVLGHGLGGFLGREPLPQVSALSATRCLSTSAQAAQEL